MKRVSPLAIALALALAGCTFLAPPSPPPEEDEEIERPGDLEGSGPLCGRVTLDAPATARVGEPIDIVASLANCGDVTLQIDRGLCPDEGSGFRLLVRGGLHDWHLHARDEPDAAALHDTPCVRGGSSVFGLPPSRGEVTIVHTVTFRWNGTFAADPCWPPPAAAVPACLQFAPATPGEVELRARIGASGVFWEANRTLGIDGEAKAEAESPCAEVDVAREDEAIRVTIDNCGATDLTLGRHAACNEPYPIRAQLVRGNESWTLRGAGAAVRDDGCHAPPMERVFPAGTRGAVALAWNGTLGVAGCDECGVERAQPGEYAIVVTLAPLEGGRWNARATILVE